MVVLKSSDNEIFEIDTEVAILSQTIKHMIEDDCADSVIPIPKVKSNVLAKVIVYCTRHADEKTFDEDDEAIDKSVEDNEDKSVEDNEAENKPVKDNESVDKNVKPVKDGGILTIKSVKDDLENFDKEFVKVDRLMMFDLLLAANYLNIKSLFDLMCAAIAKVLENFSVEEARQMFDITNDFSLEEEEAIRIENAWAFE